MKAIAVSGVEWTVRLTRAVKLTDTGGMAHVLAIAGGWHAEQVEGEERHTLKLTLSGDRLAGWGKSEELKAAWEANGWTVTTHVWRTRNRLPKPATLPLTEVRETDDAQKGGEVGAPGAGSAPGAVGADPDAPLGIPAELDRRTKRSA